MERTLALIITSVLLFSQMIHAEENSTDLMPASDTTMPNSSRTWHDEFLNCKEQWLLEPGEYVMFSNGTVYVDAYKMSYNTSFYELIGEMLALCPLELDQNEESSVNKYPLFTTYMTQIGLGISMFCLFVHLVVFMMVQDLRNGPGCNLTSLCVALFCGYLFFMVGFHESTEGHSLICVISAVLNQFFFLASFFWMSIIAVDVYRALHIATGKLRLVSTKFCFKRFVLYSLYSWGCALIFALCAIFADNVEGFPHSYRPNFKQTCWFTNRSALLVFFAIPLFIIMISNFIFFALSTYTIITNLVKNDSQENHRTSLKRNSLMYIKLGIIMGLTWCTGAIASLFDVMWLWDLFVFLNTLQGLFIFLAFTYTPKVKKYFRELLKLDPRRGSAQSLNPTFQSYCFYADSIEKDLNNILISEKLKSPPIELFV